MFIVCNFPQAILRIINSHEYNQNVGFQVFRMVVNLMEFLNASVNFYVYFVCNRQIREEAKRLIRKAKDQLTTKPKVTSCKETILGSNKQTMYGTVVQNVIQTRF